MSPPILIAQISDLHIMPPGELAYRRVDTASALARCIEELNRFTPRPDFVVISGDLVDKPSPQAYDHLVKLLAPLNVPFAAIPGNHDDRAMLRSALPNRKYAHAAGPLNSVHAVGDLDLVLIDSIVPGKHHGILDGQTLTWLDAALAASTSRPALLFLHHPPFTTGIAHMDRINLHNAADLAAILKRHERPRLIAASHVHRPVSTTFAGVAATICPAPSHAVALDLEERLPSSFLMIEPPAFHLHVWRPDEPFGSIVTHLVPIGEFAGPYPFFDGAGQLL